MRIAIAGAHGQIGLRLTRLLSDAGHEIAGLIRDPDQGDDIRAAGGEPVVCDLEHADPAEITAAVRGAGAAVFAAGAGPGSGPERKQSMDRDGAIKLVRALEADGGGAHYVMVSSMGADADASEGDMAAYLRAKGQADDALRASGLRHTIVRPGGLTDDSGTGRVRVDERTGRGQIPREDVAAVLAAVIERGGPAGQTFEVIAGDDPVDAALGALG